MSSRNDLVRAVAAANDLDDASAAAIAATALRIQSYSALRSSFDPACLMLYPSARPAEAVQQYLRRLARAAQADAADIACSSILAGQGSESDDTGDVALWLGSEDYASPELVLGALGLTEWAASGKVASTAFVARPGSHVKGLVGEMEDVFSFRVEAGNIVLFFLVGRVAGAGWAGLAGIGTWT